MGVCWSPHWACPSTGSSFLVRWYYSSRDPPRPVVLGHMPKNVELFAVWLRPRHRHPTTRFGIANPFNSPWRWMICPPVDCQSRPLPRCPQAFQGFYKAHHWTDSTVNRSRALSIWDFENKTHFFPIFTNGIIRFLCQSEIVRGETCLYAAASACPLKQSSWTTTWFMFFPSSFSILLWIHKRRKLARIRASFMYAI